MVHSDLKAFNHSDWKAIASRVGQYSEIFKSNAISSLVVFDVQNTKINL